VSYKGLLAAQKRMLHTLEEDIVGKWRERGEIVPNLVTILVQSIKTSPFASQESTRFDLDIQLRNHYILSLRLYIDKQRTIRISLQLRYSFKSSSTALAKSSQTISGPGVVSPSPPTSLEILLSSPSRYFPVFTRIRRSPRR